MPVVSVHRDATEAFAAEVMPGIELRRRRYNLFAVEPDGTERLIFTAVNGGTFWQDALVRLKARHEAGVSL